MKVRKRDDSIVNFEKEKIIVAIEKAMNSPRGKFISGQALNIANSLEAKYLKDSKEIISIYKIEDDVYYSLVDEKNFWKQLKHMRAIKLYKHLKDM